MRVERRRTEILVHLTFDDFNEMVESANFVDSNSYLKLEAELQRLYNEINHADYDEDDQDPESEEDDL